MKPTQRIDLLTTIKGTLVSFFSIFMFVTLGVGVFLGIHWLTGSLHAMADGALATGHAHDLEISYPYGLTDADLARLADLTGVDEVEAGSVAYAQLAQSDESFVLKFHTLPKGIDTFISQEGTLPTDASHVAVERTWAEKAGSYKIAGAGNTDRELQTVTRTITAGHYLRPIPRGQIDGLEMTDAEKVAYQNPAYRN